MSELQALLKEKQNYAKVKQKETKEKRTAGEGQSLGPLLAAAAKSTDQAISPELLYKASLEKPNDTAITPEEQKRDEQKAKLVMPKSKEELEKMMQEKKKELLKLRLVAEQKRIEQL